MDHEEMQVAVVGFLYFYMEDDDQKQRATEETEK
jgi:hypothetical protein